jgi:lipopolysaccharide export system protein LptA
VLIAAWLPGAAHALPEDADQPIHIRADRAEIDQNAQTVVYRGSVQADQGTMRVTADEMIVEYRDEKVTRIIARGQPATYQQQLEADRGLVKADARTITYYTQEERVDLEGEAYLSQGGNEIAGQLIQYDIVAGRVNAESGDQGPVEVTVQPATRNP